MTVGSALHPVEILAATSRVASAVEKLAGSSTNWVAVRLPAGGDISWFVLDRATTLEQLGAQSSDHLVLEALDLLTIAPDHSVTGAQLAAGLGPLPTPTLVVDGARVVGVVPPNSPVAARPPARSAPRKVTRSAPSATVPAVDSGTQTLFASPRVVGPTRVELGQRFRLDVGLSADGRDMAIEAPASAETISLDIHVVAPGFDFVDGAHRQLEAAIDDVAAAMVSIDAVASQPPDEIATLSDNGAETPAWPTAVTVLYLHRGNPVGTVQHRLIVDLGTPAQNPMPAEPSQWLIDQSEPEATPIVVELPEPDVTIIIDQDSDPTSGRHVAMLRSPHVDVSETSYDINLGVNAADFAATITKAIPAQDGSPFIDETIGGIAKAIARTIAPGFWESLRSALSAAVAAGGDQVEPTVLLLTSDPFIPWELADIGEAVVDDSAPPLLAAQARVGRWMLDPTSDTPIPAAAELEVTRIAAVIGEYEPTSRLPALEHAVKEGGHLRDAFGATYVSARSTDVEIVLGAQLRTPFQILHFACHGDANLIGANALYMNDGSELLEYAIEGSNAGREYAPFVFLNACRVGSGDRRLNQYGGFAGSFLRAGYRGFVGPLWAVDDTVAHEIALEFYDRIAAGEGPAQVLRAVRSRFAATADQPTPPATLLAYVYYGHPATIVRGLEKRAS